MLRIAILGLRGRVGAFVGAFVALLVAAVLVMACGVLMESGIRAHAPVERYAGAAVVIAGVQDVGADHDVALTERARVDASLAARLARVPGVRAAIADVSVPAQLGARATVAHGWSSAALTPYALRAGRTPAGRDEVVAGFPARVGEHVRLAAAGPARTVTIVGVAAPRTPVHRQAAIFLADAEAARLAGHAGRADAIGVLAAPDADPRALAARVRGASAGTRLRVLTGDARGQAEYLDVARARDTLIAVAGAFGGLALLIAMFVVASTLGLSIQQREREIALLRAVAATPGQVRRMIAWEALIVGLLASAAGLWPGAQLGRVLGRALARHGVAPDHLAVHAGWIPMVVAVGGGVLTALIAVAAAGRRAARVRPTRALQDAAVEPRLLGPVRALGGLLALGGGGALLAVSLSSSDRDTAATTAAVTAFVLVLAAAFLGPLVARAAAWLPGAAIARVAPVGGFLAVANVRTAARRFSAAGTPLVLTVAMACSLLFVTTTQDHATSVQTRAALTGQLALSGPDLPPAALADVRATRGVTSAAGLAATSLGPSLGVGDDIVPAQVLDLAAGAGGLDLGVRAGSLGGLHGDAIALSAARAKGAHARVGQRVPVILGDGTHSRARVVAIYSRDLAFGDAVLSPALVAGHRTDDRLDTIMVQTADPAGTAARLRRLAARYPGLRVAGRARLASATDAERETNRWLNRVLTLVIFAFTSIAVVNTLTMIALQRGRELALLRLVGGTSGQIAAMARWEAILIVTVGIGLGIAISLATLLPFSQALTGSPRPYVPLDQAGAILGITAALGLIAAQLPTRLTMRGRPLEAI